MGLLILVHPHPRECTLHYCVVRSDLYTTLNPFNRSQTDLGPERSSGCSSGDISSQLRLYLLHLHCGKPWRSHPCVETMDVSALGSFSVTASLCGCICGSGSRVCLAVPLWSLCALAPLVPQLTTHLCSPSSRSQSGGRLQVGRLSQEPY